jgi:SAM-dependent methyltransferase
MDDRTFDDKTALDWMASIENEKSRARDLDLYPKLRDWTACLPGRHVLEIGCGQGICSPKIAPMTYTGADPSPRLIARAKELYASDGRAFVVGNAYALPFADGAFDAAFAVSVWHLLEDVEKASRELARVLAPKGHFALSTANPASYPAWIALYEDAALVGTRLDGRMRLEGQPPSRDVLHLHPVEKILGALEGAGLVVKKTETFRPARNASDPDYYLWVEGQKGT